MKNEILGYYVVERNHEDNLDQLSILLNTYEEAKKFKNSEYEKLKHPHSFIVGLIKDQ